MSPRPPLPRRLKVKTEAEVAEDEAVQWADCVVETPIA
jgi:hypothetical protein